MDLNVVIKVDESAREILTELGKIVAELRAVSVTTAGDILSAARDSAPEPIPAVCPAPVSAPKTPPKEVSADEVREAAKRVLAAFGGQDAGRPAVMALLEKEYGVNSTGKVPAEKRAEAIEKLDALATSQVG